MSRCIGLKYHVEDVGRMIFFQEYELITFGRRKGDKDKRPRKRRAMLTGALAGAVTLGLVGRQLGKGVGKVTVKDLPDYKALKKDSLDAIDAVSAAHQVAGAQGTNAKVAAKGIGKKVAKFSEIKKKMEALEAKEVARQQRKLGLITALGGSGVGYSVGGTYYNYKNRKQLQ